MSGCLDVWIEGKRKGDHPFGQPPFVHFNCGRIEVVQKVSRMGSLPMLATASAPYFSLKQESKQKGS